jgi:anti-sigma factor RsiW
MLYPTTSDPLAFHVSVTRCWLPLIPLPVTFSVVGELAALLLNEILPEAVPLLCGVNRAEKETRWPAGIVKGKRNPVTVNSELEVVADETVTLVPLAARLPPTLLLVPTVTLPKLRVEAPKLSLPAEPPVPQRAMGIFRFGALEAMAIIPFTLEADLGRKVPLKV